MTVSLCKHSHPVQPPVGTILRPGPCTDCGITWDEVQDEVRRQEDALINGTAHEGTCPDCGQHRTLLRFQPPSQPWEPFDYEPPVSFLCLDCYNAAAIEFNAGLAAVYGSI
ncbi:hypothetical protein ABTX82_01525 [Streptomyces lavendulae]|uniref:hypothetical protein n=1 Tax=Streptomyces lavendulae TaxID=1914 RepID=UPI00331CAD73